MTPELIRTALRDGAGNGSARRTSRVVVIFDNSQLVSVFLLISALALVCFSVPSAQLPMRHPSSLRLPATSLQRRALSSARSRHSASRPAFRAAASPRCRPNSTLAIQKEKVEPLSGGRELHVRDRPISSTPGACAIAVLLCRDTYGTFQDPLYLPFSSTTNS